MQLPKVKACCESHRVERKNERKKEKGKRKGKERKGKERKGKEVPLFYVIIF